MGKVELVRNVTRYTTRRKASQDSEWRLVQ